MKSKLGLSLPNVLLFHFQSEGIVWAAMCFSWVNPTLCLTSSMNSTDQKLKRYDQNLKHLKATTKHIPRSLLKPCSCWAPSVLMVLLRIIMSETTVMNTLFSAVPPDTFSLNLHSDHWDSSRAVLWYPRYIIPWWRSYCTRQVRSTYFIQKS